MKNINVKEEEKSEGLSNKAKNLLIAGAVVGAGLFGFAKGHSIGLSTGSARGYMVASKEAFDAIREFTGELVELKKSKGE